jgi:hypothetical protein
MLTGAVMGPVSHKSVFNICCLQLLVVFSCFRHVRLMASFGHSRDKRFSALWSRRLA